MRMQCILVMNPFSSDFLKMQILNLGIYSVLTQLIVGSLHSTWFLDLAKTS